MRVPGRAVLLIQRVTRMLHILKSFEAPLAPPYFSTLSHKRHGFRKKVLDIKCVLVFRTTFFPKMCCSRRIWRYVVRNMMTSSCKVPLFLSDFSET